MLVFDLCDFVLVCCLLVLGLYDFGFVVVDNCYSWLVFVVGCCWIVVYDGDVLVWKNWLVDECCLYFDVLAVWGDLIVDLVDGGFLCVYWLGDWLVLLLSVVLLVVFWEWFYVVLYLGVSMMVKCWLIECW